MKRVALLDRPRSKFDLVGEFFGRVGPDFGEGWVVMRGGGELVDGHTGLHGHDDFVDEFAAMGADATAAEDFAVFGVGQ